MEKEVGLDVIKATQTSLGKYVKRPPLNEKLLKKPPFRFLHDIVTAVHKTNGFFEGLFEPNELISENVKDRESKILFLNKVITILASTTGKNITAKPSKIIAGQEPEKTNEMLQCLAYALEKNLSSDEAVKKFNENSKRPPDVKSKDKESNKTVKKTTSTKKLTSQSNEKLTSNRESTTVNKIKANDAKSKTKEKEKSKLDIQPKKSQNLKITGKKTSVESVDPPSTKEISIQNKQNPTEDDTTPKKLSEIKQEMDSKSSEVIKEHVDTLPSLELGKLNEDTEHQEKSDESYNATDNDLNAPLSSQDLMDVDISKERQVSTPKEERNEISSKETNKAQKEKVTPVKVETPEKPRPMILRHESLDSELTRRDSNNINNDKTNPISTTRPSSGVVRPSSVRPPSSRPGAPRLREKTDSSISKNDNLILGKVNIISENDHIEEEEDILIIERREESSQQQDQQASMQLLQNEHGHLVQQILDSQKELSQASGKTEIEWQFGAQKAREAANQELEQLRFNIQALSRVSNPLGKLLDHIQEDVEVMRQEQQQWTKIYEDVSKDMVKQKASNDESLFPLQARIKQLDMEVIEKRDKINDIKVLVHKNSSRIEKLLANGNVQ